MGILFQKSCFREPDYIFKAIDPGRITKNKWQKLQGRRRRQLNSIAEEARAWMYAILLPTEIIANGDARIKQNLDEETARLTSKLLGSKIDPFKIDCVCAKIANNIFAPGLANIEPGAPYAENYPDHPEQATDDEMAHLLDHRHIKAEYLDMIWGGAANFEDQHPDARTWSEIRQVAGNYSILGVPLPTLLDSWQRRMTRLEYGVPHTQTWTDHEQRDVWARIRSVDPLRLPVDFRQTQRDVILVRAEAKDPEDSNNIARVNNKHSIMTLFPGFFDTQTPDSLRDVLIRSRKDKLESMNNKVVTLLHEIMHSGDVLWARDHSFEYHRGAIDCIWDSDLVVSYRGLPYYTAYGLESCLALVRRDELNNTNKAEDNAESWAFYFAFRVLLLVYPELNVVSALLGESTIYQKPRIIRQRSQPLHHCTLFQVLRNQATPKWPTSRLYPAHDESRDWCKENLSFGAPKTVAALVTLLQLMLRER